MSELRPYTVRLLLHPDTDSETRAGLEAMVRSWVEERGGTLGPLSTATPRRLAYPIQHIQNAVVTTVTFRLPAQDLHDLRAQLQRAKGLLRCALYQQPPRTPGRKTLGDLPPRSAAGLAPAPKKEKASLEKLDEKIEEILEEKVL